MKEKMMGTSQANDIEPSYKRNNMTQIFKIRHLFRKNGYFERTEEEHVDLEESSKLEEDLLLIKSIGQDNLNAYLRKVEDGTSEEIKIAYVTTKDKEESEKLENKTVNELKKLIFEQINCLPIDAHELMEDVFKSSVKTKGDHIKFLNELFEHVQSNGNESSEESDENEDS